MSIHRKRDISEKNDISLGNNSKKSWPDLKIASNHLQRIEIFHSWSKLYALNPRKLKQRYEKDTSKHWKYTMIQSSLEAHER